MRKKIRRVPYLLFTDERCVINKRPEPNLPVLLDSTNKVVWPVTDWFRYMRVAENRPSSSIGTLADHLRQFWEFLEGRGVEWQDVNDELLMLYRNMQQLGQRVSKGQKAVGVGNTNVEPIDKKSINGRLISIFKFYYWCFNHGLIGSDVIGATDWTNSSNPTPPQITVNFTIQKGHGDRKIIQPTSPLLFKSVSKKLQPIPTNDEVFNLHAKLVEKHTPHVGWRNILMASIQEQVGLRRAELHFLKINQIPSEDIIDELMESERLYAVDVVGKGSKTRTVSFTPELLRILREYIDDARAKLVARMKITNPRRKRFKAYREPKEIFLGETTGLSLSVGAIGECLSAGFRESGSDIRPHRLRAKFLNDMVGAKCFALWDKHGMRNVNDVDILAEVAEMAGHSDIKSLGYYINLAKKCYLKLSAAERVLEMERRQKSAERMLVASHARLKENKELVAVAKAINSGDKDKARALLSKMLSELDRQ